MDTLSKVATGIFGYIFLYFVVRILSYIFVFSNTPKDTIEQGDPLYNPMLDNEIPFLFGDSALTVTAIIVSAIIFMLGYSNMQNNAEDEAVASSEDTFDNKPKQQLADDGLPIKSRRRRRREEDSESDSQGTKEDEK